MLFKVVTLWPGLLFWQTLMAPAPQKAKVHVRTSLAAITLNPRIGNIHSKHLVSDLKCCPNLENIISVWQSIFDCAIENQLISLMYFTE